MPKFHCSRCDSVFELQPKSHSHHASQAKNASSQRWVLADNSDANIPNPFAQPVTHSQTPESSIKAGDFTLGTPANEAILEPRKPFAPLEERAGLSLLGLRPSAGATVASSMITRQQALSQMPAQIPDSTQLEDDPFALFDPPGAGAARGATTPTPPVEPLTIQPQTRVELPPPVQAKVEPATPPKKLVADKPTPTPPARTEDRTTEVEAPRRRTWRPGRVKELATSALARLSERNQNLTRLSLPVLSTVGAVCILGYAARLMPQTLDSIFQTLVPSVITGKISRLPDPSLQVQQVTLEFEKTQSKETIPVVRGVINNTADNSIQDVLVEALGFNARGEVVVRAQAPLRSALARERISDLPLETVKKFQTSLSARNSTIGAGEKVAFTVALLPENGAANEVNYFSARIFSVGNSR